MSRRLESATILQAACCGAVVAAIVGCTPAADVRPGDIRTYSVARTPPVAGPSAAATPRPDPAARLRYDLPPGWSERQASGMRLATLAIGDPAAGHEVTIVPATGSLRGNVERWLGQLDGAGGAADADRDAAVDRAVADARTVDVDGTPAAIVTLFDAAAAAGPDAPGQAILAAMIPGSDGSALFVKFKGDAAVARREREAFARFVASLRWK